MTVYLTIMKMQKLFEEEYKLWRIIQAVGLFVKFYDIWAIIAIVYHTEDVWDKPNVVGWAITGICYVLPILEFVYSSSRMNNEYHRFVDALWNYGLRINVSDIMVMLIIFSLCKRLYV